MEATTLQLAVVTPLDDLRNREIKSNIKDLLPIVEAKANEYKTTVYGIAQEKMCKEHRATLNKFVNSISDEVKAVGEANNAPFVQFKSEVQPIIDTVIDAIGILDKQLLEMETIWRTNNIENAKLLYDSIIGSGKFGSWLPWEKILITKKTGRVNYEDFFGNKTTWSYPEGYEGEKDVETLSKAGKKVVEIFENLNRFTQDKLDAINEIDYPEEIKMQGIGYLQTSYDPLKRGFDMDGAINFMTRLKKNEDAKREAVERAKREAEAEKQKALEEERRKAEEEKQRAIAEVEQKAREEAEKAVREELKFKKNVNAPAPGPEEKIFTVRFEAKVTAGQAKDLRMFCDSIGITLTPIK